MSGDIYPTLPYRYGETPVGFVSRLAALHKIDAREFCRDMGFAFQAIVDGCGRALVALADLAGAHRSELRDEAIVKTSERTYVFRGETLLGSSLRRSRVMTCPACLAEDISCEAAAGWSAWSRTIWTLDPIRTCTVHNLVLIEVVNVREPTYLHDFAANVSTAIARLPELQAAARRRRPSGLETYLLDRLKSVPRPDAAWLGDQPWHAAADACHLLGAVGLHGRDVPLRHLTDDDWHAAGDAGFAIARDGEDGVLDLLRYLDASYPRSRISTEGAQAVYGKLFRMLASDRDDGAETLRKIMYEHVARTQPVAPDQSMFGRPFGPRSKHSIRSASLEYAIHPKRLRKILETKGVLVPGETDERSIFDSEANRSLLEMSKGALSLRETEKYLNTNRVHARILMQKGFIKPFVSFGCGEYNFASSALDGFLKLLTRNAILLGEEEDGSFDIPSAAKRVNCGAAEIVMLIVWGDLDWIGRFVGQDGYLGIRVRCSELKRRIHDARPSGKTAREVEKTLRTASRTVTNLITRGHLTPIRVINPINRCPLILVTDESLAEFRKTYVSLFNLAEERGVHFTKIRADLAKRNIQPALSPAAFHATFYRRTDLS